MAFPSVNWRKFSSNCYNKYKWIQCSEQYLKNESTSSNFLATNLQKLFKRCSCVLDTLALFHIESNAETRLFAILLLSAIQTNKFVVLLVFFARFNKYSEFATRCLQNKTLQVSSGVILTDDLKDLATSIILIAMKQ